MRLCWLLIREGSMRVPACGGVSHARDAVRSMMIADSPSLPRKALASALDVTHSFGLAVEVIGTREFENELYVSNPPNRCYFCKAELFTKMEMLAAECGFSALAHGENASFLKLTLQKHMLSAMVLSRGILCDRWILSRRHRRPSTRALQAASGPIDHWMAFDCRCIAVAGTRYIVGLGPP